MILRTRMCRPMLVLGSVFAVAGCCCVPQQSLQQAQLRTMQMYQQNRQLAMQRDGLSQQANALSAENQSLKQNLDVATQRLSNLQSSNTQLEQRVKNLLASARTGNSPLSDDATRRLEELRRKYPQFEFDPATGVSKFSSDLLFESGSDEVRDSNQQMLREFAQIMNQQDTQHLRVLVVGHTDDRPIAKPGTKAKHPTNWHLSTNRANSVLLALKQHHVNETRMEAAGCGMTQPVKPNSNDTNRRENRRVEIFVLAPDAKVAGNLWDPASSLQ